jgi:hypothetical protein
MKNSKTPRFLLCENPLLKTKELFILCTRSGELLIKVVNLPGNSFSLEVVKVYNATDKQISNALADTSKWYVGARHAYK